MGAGQGCLGPSAQYASWGCVFSTIELFVLFIYGMGHHPRHQRAGLASVRLKSVEQSMRWCCVLLEHWGGQGQSGCGPQGRVQSCNYGPLDKASAHPFSRRGFPPTRASSAARANARRVVVPRKKKKLQEVVAYWAAQELDTTVFSAKPLKPGDPQGVFRTHDPGNNFVFIQRAGRFRWIPYADTAKPGATGAGNASPLTLLRCPTFVLRNGENFVGISNDAFCCCFLLLGVSQSECNPPPPHQTPARPCKTTFSRSFLSHK